MLRGFDRKVVRPKPMCCASVQCLSFGGRQCRLCLGAQKFARQRVQAQPLAVLGRGQQRGLPQQLLQP